MAVSLLNFRHLTRRSMLAGAGSLMGSVVVAGCGKPPVRRLSEVTLRLAAAKEGAQHFFKDAGEAAFPYEVEYSELPFDLALQSISGNQIDFGFHFSDIPLAIWGRSLEGCRIVAVVGIDPASRLLSLIARPGLKASSIASLKGRKVGYLRSSNYHYYLLTLLEKAGLEWNDIEAISLNRDTLPAAFSSGQLDFWITQGLETLTAQQRFGGRVVDQIKDGYAGNGVVVASRETLGDPLRVQALGDYLLRLRRVFAWMHRENAQVAKRFAELTGVDQALFEQTFTHRRQPTQVLPISDQAIAAQRVAGELFARFGQAAINRSNENIWDRRLTKLLS